MNYTRRVAGGLKVTIGASVVSVVVQSAIMVVMVRLVSANDFGAYAIALVFAWFSTWFVTSAIERSLVVSPDAEALVGRTIPVGLVVCGVGALAILVAVGINLFTPFEMPLGAVGGIVLAQSIAGFSIVPRVHLRMQLRFHRLVIAELAAQTLGTGVVAAVLAWQGLGVGAIVAGANVYSLIVLFGLTSGVPGRLAWPVRTTGNLGLIRQALATSQTNLVEVINSQIPVLVIGWLGQATLGVFNRAYNLVQLPVQMVVASVNRVFVSALVTVENEQDRRRRAARILTQVVATVTTPVCLGVAGAAREFTGVIMGHEWDVAIPAIPFIAISTWGTITAQSFATMIEAARHFEAKARLQVITGALQLLAIVAGAAMFGLPGATAGMAIGGVALLVVLGWYASRLLELGPTVVMRWLLPSLAAGMLCFAWTAGLSMLAPWPELPLFGAQVMGCAVLTGGYFVLFERGFLRELIAAARR